MNNETQKNANRGKTRLLPGGLDARGNLVAALTAAVGDDHAVAVVDALDVYLETDPSDRTPPLMSVAPKPAVRTSKGKSKSNGARSR